MEFLGPLVSALEFGITPEEKVEIGSKAVPRLIGKIADDLISQQRKSIEFEEIDAAKSVTKPKSQQNNSRSALSAPLPTTSDEGDSNHCQSICGDRITDFEPFSGTLRPQSFLTSEFLRAHDIFNFQ